MRSRASCGTMLIGGLALLLSAAFVISLPVAIIAFDVGRVAFSVEMVSEAIASRLVEGGAFHEVFVGALFGEGGQETDLGQAFSRLDPQEQQEALRLLIPQGWATDQVSRVVRGLYSWLDSSREAPDVSIDLQPIRQNLLTGAAPQLVELVVDSWPPCTIEELDRISSSAAATGEVPVLYCEPSEPFRGLMVEFATGSLLDQARQMPTVLSLGPELVQNTQAGQVEAVKEQLRLVRLLARAGWMLPAALLGLVMALAVRSWSGLGRWWGVPIAAAGAVTLVLAALGGAYAAGALERAAGAAAGRVLESAVPAVASALLDQVLGRILLHGGLGALGGGIVFGLGLALGRRAPADAPAAGGQAPAPAGERSDGPPPSGLFG